MWACSTCALAAGVFSLGGAEKPAVEVFLPELGKPHVPPIVLQREPGEVFIKAWGIEGERKWESGRQFRTNYQPGGNEAELVHRGRRWRRHQRRLFGENTPASTISSKVELSGSSSSRAP